MDNMLYIIAGLVLILLIAGLVLRKKKAQPPAAKPHIKSGKDTLTSTAISKTARVPATQDHKEADNKFDHITIAQRFMDQQRYDKAIETLERGLVKKPKDNKLLLKLLSIYATINQPENFNKVYDTIKMQNDAESIVLADELKALFSEDNNQFEKQEQKVAQDLPVSNESNFGSLDFDLPTSQDDSQNALSETPIIDSNSDALVNKTVEDSFDLTLSDLENDFNESEVTDTAPVTALDLTDDVIVDETNSPIDDKATSSEESDINDLSDFDFSLDSTEENDTLSASPVASESVNSSNEDITLENDDFILDFDDLVNDSVKNNDATIAAELTNDANQSIEEELTLSDDFTLSLDNSADSIAESNTIESELTHEAPTFEDSADIENFVLDDNGFEDNNVVDNSFEDSNVESINMEQSFEETSVAPTAPLLFDDNTELDDAFTLDAPTAATPVNAEPDTSAETAEDFSARFAEDFDFVKSLDSNQVTLDLASQYLQLGEYDSAKRLLNEVIAQGNSEQQSQAKDLLERTA